MPHDHGDFSEHAMLWENGHVEELSSKLPPHSGWVLYSARAINNRGQIVDEGKYRGKVRNYLMTPVS